MDFHPEPTAGDVARASELGRRPDQLVVPIMAGILARCLLHSDGCTIDSADLREETMERARHVARLAADRRPWRADPAHVQARVLRFLEVDAAHFQPWIAGGLAYYALDMESRPMQEPTEYVERFRHWYELRQPSALEAILVCMDCAGRVARTRGARMHLLAPAAKPLRAALLEPYQAYLQGSWQRALAWAFSEWTIDSLTYFSLNLASSSTALAYRLNDVAALVRRACTERDQAIAERASLEEAEVVRRAEQLAVESAAAATARAEAAEAALATREAELRAVNAERDRLANRLAGALSRIETLEGEVDGRERGEATAEPAAPPRPVASPRDSAPAPPSLDGVRIFLFTNQERAGVRQEIRAGFEALGAAAVDVIDVSRSQGPSSYPAEAVVVADITFMAHSDADAVKARAAKAGCRFLPLRGGSATLAERTAAWLAKRPPGDDGAIR